MKYVKNLKPILEEKEFANRILQEIYNYETEYYFLMLEFDKDVARESKNIIRYNDNNIDKMINLLTKYLNGAWSIKSTLYSMYAIQSLKSYLLEVVSEIGKDHKIRVLQENNSKLNKALESMNDQKKASDDKHKEEVEQLKKDAALDKKHLETTVGVLSDVVKKEIVSLKESVLSRDAELNRVKQENADLLKIISKLQKQVRPTASHNTL